MNLLRKIGQMLLFGWKGTTSDENHSFNDHASRLIDELYVGGVIVMGRNVDTPAQLRHTLHTFQSRAQDSLLPPLFMGVDQEGGRVNRLNPPHFSHQPSAKEIGTSGEPEQARLSARTIGLELRSVGINWNFAPVLDVNNNPNNPVIGDRSYGDEPYAVAAMGIAAVLGYQEDAQLLACGKHFPGHGDTDTDSHHALPRISHTANRLRQIELVPFQAAISSGLAAIMTSHILFPAIDPNLPATLSPAILGGLLRQEMDFGGLVITDCLEMKGVSVKWGSAEAAVLAVIAGADILLSCHTYETQRVIRDALVSAVRSGRISEDRIDASLVRIAQAKERWIPTAAHASSRGRD